MRTRLRHAYKYITNPLYRQRYRYSAWRRKMIEIMKKEGFK